MLFPIKTIDVFNSTINATIFLIVNREIKGFLLQTFGCRKRLLTLTRIGEGTSRDTDAC